MQKSQKENHSIDFIQGWMNNIANMKKKKKKKEKKLFKSSQILAKKTGQKGKKKF